MPNLTPASESHGAAQCPVRRVHEDARQWLDRRRRMRWRSLPPLAPSCCRMGGVDRPDHDATPRVGRPRPRCSLKPNDSTIGGSMNELRNELRDDVIAAHGGLDRWNELTSEGQMRPTLPLLTRMFLLGPTSTKEQQQSGVVESQLPRDGYPYRAQRPTDSSRLWHRRGDDDAGSAGHERVRARGWRRLPHLFGVHARAGRPLGDVPVARPRATRAQRDDGARIW